MEKIEKGSVIEVNVPNVEKPIKAVVLDIEETPEGDSQAYYTYILYAQNKLFKVYNSCHWGSNIIEVTPGEFDEVQYEEWTNFKYGGIIVDYCEIPCIPSVLN